MLDSDPANHLADEATDEPTPANAMQQPVADDLPRPPSGRRSAIRPAGRELHLRVQQRKDALCQRHACQHARCLRMDHGFGPRIPGYDSFGRYIATADIFLKPARELTVHSEHL